METDFSAEIGNSNVFSAQNQVVSKKKKKVFIEIGTDFSEIQTFFPPKTGGLQKKKKVFTEMETDFSAKIVRLRLVGGMYPKMDTDFSKWRLIFRPKSLVLGWLGGMHPPIPPLNPPLAVTQQLVYNRQILCIAAQFCCLYCCEEFHSRPVFYPFYCFRFCFAEDGHS